MFRMGGRSDDGIMSVRRGYAEGDSVRADIEKEIYPSSLLGLTNRVTGGINDLLYNYGVRPLGNIAQYITKTNPDYIEPRNSKEEMIDLVLKNRGLDTDGINLMGSAEASETDQTVKPEITTTTDTDTKTQELSDNDLKTMYEDLLPLFKSELSADEDELKRQKYLELAKFGANILAQPGGDLIGSVGRAAAPSIEGLTRIAEAKRRSDAAAKAMALEAALKQMDPGELKKNYRELIELGYTPEEAKKYLVERGSGTREATKQNIIERRAKAFVNDGIVETDTAGEKAANTISKFDLDLSDVSKLPDSEAELEKDQYYIKKDGSIRRFDGEKLLTPSDKGFK